MRKLEMKSLLAVLLAELMGELIERMARPAGREHPNREAVRVPVRRGGGN